MKISATLLLFSGIVFLYSCSVEKRLYTQGYHLNWNKKIKGSDAKLTAENLSPEEETNEESLLQNNQPITTDQPANKQITSEPKSENQSFVHSNESKSISEIIQKTSKKEDQPDDSKTIIKKQKEQKTQIKRDKKERSNNGKALLLLINAIVFALLGLVFVTYFGVFGLIFGIIFYSAAIIMLIVSIIYLIL